MPQDEMTKEILLCFEMIVAGNSRIMHHMIACVNTALQTHSRGQSYKTSFGRNFN